MKIVWTRTMVLKFLDRGWEELVRFEWRRITKTLVPEVGERIGFYERNPVTCPDMRLARMKRFSMEFGTTEDAPPKMCLVVKTDGGTTYHVDFYDIVWEDSRGKKWDGREVPRGSTPLANRRSTGR